MPFHFEVYKNVLKTSTEVLKSGEYLLRSACVISQIPGLGGHLVSCDTF